MFISQESFLNFFLNLYIPPWFQKSFKFIVLRLLQICESINWISPFLAMSPSKTFPRVFIIIAQADGNCPLLPKSVSWRCFFLRRKWWRRSGSWKNYQNRQRHRSQVLINFTIFATLTFLVYVLLRNNLASSMLRCEGSLTKKIFTKKYNVQE